MTRPRRPSVRVLLSGGPQDGTSWLVEPPVPPTLRMPDLRAAAAELEASGAPYVLVTQHLYRRVALTVPPVYVHVPPSPPQETPAP